MKDMIYMNSKKIDVLHSGIYKDLEFYIVSFGSHPCAYVKIPENNKYCKADYSDIDITCHGGLTYSNNSLSVCDNKESGWWIGWDYVYNEFFPIKLQLNGKNGQLAKFLKK